MRKFLQIGSCCLLFAACKPLARHAASDIQAISDDRLALGMVPAQRSDGMQAYRMLLCQKMHSYSPYILADDSRCRVALHNNNGEEVVFFPNDFKRSFGAKYKGYAKQATILSIAVVPVALVGGIAGGWTILRKLKNFSEKDIKIGSKLLDGKFTAGLVEAGLGEKGWRYYEAAWSIKYEDYSNLLKNNEYKLALYEAANLEKATETLTSASLLKSLTDGKKLIKRMEKLSPNKLASRYSVLENEIKALNNGVLGHEEGSFLHEMNKQRKYTNSLFKESQSIKPAVEKENTYTQLESELLKYKDNVLRKFDIDAKMLILKNKDTNDFNTLTKEIDKVIKDTQDELLSNEEDILRMYIEAHQFRATARQRAAVAATGVGAGFAAALLAIDKSIWGYADRQIKKHWNQVFMTNDSFANLSETRDVLSTLKLFANELGFVINSRALQLAP